jgi:oligosaccharyltransferase complex subunit beta
LLFLHQNFSIIVEEYSGAAAAWVPFTAQDVQLEFTMLDPYIRLDLSTTGNGVYSAAFQVPDVYGVYKFVVEYRRAGYSNLDVASQVSVHPFKHDEFERFIGQAYPYYASAFTLMAAFFTFGIVFLYQKD